MGRKKQTPGDAGGMPPFLSGGGEMGALMRAHDWSRSSLGHPSAWPQSLRTIVRLMLNTGHPMYVWWGDDGACLYNDAYRQYIGPERHPGSLGRPAREVWDEIWPIIGPQIEQVMSGGGATWHVNQLVPITRHGRLDEVYWTYSYSPIDDEAAPGGIGGVLVVCTETTQQVLTARQLAGERDRLAQMFEQAPTFMALLSGPEHRFELANPSYVEMVGHRPVIGRTVAEALPEAAEQGYIDLLDRVYASGEAHTQTAARYAVPASPDRPTRERWMDFVYQPIKDAEGRVTGIFVLGADVTERVQAEAFRREAADALGASEARYRALAAQLSDANQRKDEFLATLAHELRNPLAPMRTALELMRRAPQDGEVAASARDVMGRQLAQVVRLIDDLLDLSRVSRGIIELRRARVRIAEVLQDAVETSRPLIEQCGHTLTITDAGEALTVYADQTRIVQIFANLLNNAAKFTPAGGRIELRAARERGDMVAVSVRDNGVGIPSDMLQHVFEMFTQVDHMHTQSGGGLGIGLTLVRRLAEMHGGSVEARSAGSGTGSEFLVRLPLAPQTADAARPAADAAPDSRTPAPPLRIVVADDNIDAAASLSTMLQLMGHDTRTAHDGHAALAVAREFRPEVMILDIAMPSMGGHEAARCIRKEDWGANVLLIAASGWGQPGDRQQSLDAGFDHHLVKPVDIEGLEGLLRESHGARPARPAVDAPPESA
jgi:PAS domain S-box-containing protein